MTTTPTASADTTLIEAAEIKIKRGEGPNELVTGEWISATGDAAWDETRDVLRRWSFSAPRNGTVDKVDFVVTYTDGNTYTGTFGLQFTDTDLGAHMRRHLDYIVANVHGLHDPCDIRDASEFLATYRIG